MQSWLLIPILAVSLSAAPPAHTHAPVRVDSSIQERKLLYGPGPVYPQRAVDAQIGGSVRLEVTVGKGGAVEGVKPLSGHPLLVPAAVLAVEQWEYRPTLRNGLPVEVSTIVTVNFLPSPDAPGKPSRKQAVVYSAMARD
jgi:protein TonB